MIVYKQRDIDVIQIKEKVTEKLSRWFGLVQRKPLETLVRMIDLHCCYFCRKERGTKKDIGDFFF